MKMAKKKEKQVEEVIKVEVEEEVEESPTAEEGGSWTEQFEVAGEELLSFLQMLFNEVNVRRIMVHSSSGRTLLDIPVAVGLVGFFPPLLMYTAVALGAAVLTNCTITVERVETGEKAPEAPAAE
jgi:hypothetical protein